MDLPDEDPSWPQAWYNAAIEDIRWAKEQAWRITNRSVVLLVGILVASIARRGVAPLLPANVVWLAYCITAAIPIAAWLWLRSLYGFAAGARSRVHAILDPHRRLGDPRSYPIRREHWNDPNHEVWLAFQTVVVVVTADLVAAALPPSQWLCLSYGVSGFVPLAVLTDWILRRVLP